MVASPRDISLLYGNIPFKEAIDLIIITIQQEMVIINIAVTIMGKEVSGTIILLGYIYKRGHHRGP